MNGHIIHTYVVIYMHTYIHAHKEDFCFKTVSILSRQIWTPSPYYLFRSKRTPSPTQGPHETFIFDVNRLKLLELLEIYGPYIIFMYKNSWWSKNFSLLTILKNIDTNFCYA